MNDSAFHMVDALQLGERQIFEVLRNLNAYTAVCKFTSKSVNRRKTMKAISFSILLLASAGALAHGTHGFDDFEPIEPAQSLENDPDSKTETTEGDISDLDETRSLEKQAPEQKDDKDNDAQPE
ncbi:hypothetical protein GYB61_12185 [bacterium]|nr:hypothetical protein [bacterium]